MHRNYLIFGTKVNLDNIYTLTIFKLFEKFLIPSNPPLILLKRFKNEVFWSLDEVVGDLRIHARAYVRASVRHAVAQKPFINFF